MLNNELLNKDPDAVSEQVSIIIFYSKSAIFVDKNGKDTKHTIHISRIMYFVRNGEEYNLHKTVWCEGGLKPEDIGTKNVRKDELNHISFFLLFWSGHRGSKAYSLWGDVVPSSSIGYDYL